MVHAPDPWAAACSMVMVNEVDLLTQLQALGTSTQFGDVALAQRRWRSWPHTANCPPNLPLVPIQMLFRASSSALLPRAQRCVVSAPCHRAALRPGTAVRMLANKDDKSWGDILGDAANLAK